MALSLNLPTLPPGLKSNCSLQAIVIRLATVGAAIVSLSGLATQAAADGGPSFENGTYLYGESPTADTVGAVYFVFQVDANVLTGAMYQPLSSFDCVHGKVGQGHLQLTVVDAYDQAERPYTIALTPADATVASVQNMSQFPDIVGMHPIHPLAELDHQLLEACLQ